MIKAVYFDWWNTLYYCPTRNRVDRIIKKLGLEFSYRSFMDRFENAAFRNKDITSEMFIMDLMESVGRPVDGKTAAEMGRVWASRLDDAYPFPEVLDALKDLHREFKICLISNTDASGMEYIKKQPIMKQFDEVVLSCEVGFIKPEGGLYELSLKKLGVKPYEACMVGDDREADVLGSIRAGMHGILVDRKGREVSASFPVIKNIAEVKNVITRL